MGSLENKTIKFYSRWNSNIVLRVVPGHFVTSHSHINYYIDMTGLKTRRSEAQAVARAFAQSVRQDAVIDTIVCMDGCEVIGAYLAEELEGHLIRSMNRHHTIYIVTPEFYSADQMIFRDNVAPAIRDKHVLLLMATSTTGQTIDRCRECVQYYGGTVEKICSVFSATNMVSKHEIETIFTLDDLPGYQAYSQHDCPMCREKRKIDAFVNGYGYSIV